MLKILGAIVAIALILVMGSVYIVDQREQAITLRFGEPVGDIVNGLNEDEPGLKFKRPFIFESVLKFDKRILELNAEPREVIASDQKRLIIDAFAKYQIVNPLLFYQSVRDERGASARLASILDSQLREVVAQHELNALLTEKRKEIMETAQERVNSEVGKLGINVVDLRIMRADLPKENNETIYNQMRTEREKEAREFRAQGAEEAQRITSRADKEKTVLLANARKESEIIRGNGDAEATKIFAEAFGRDEEFYKFYRTMQAYRNTLKKGDTTMILSPDSEFLEMLGEIKPAR